jgi:hypothetical protein
MTSKEKITHIEIADLNNNGNLLCIGWSPDGGDYWIGVKTEKQRFPTWGTTVTIGTAGSGTRYPGLSVKVREIIQLILDQKNGEGA